MAVDIHANFTMFDALGKPFGAAGLLAAMERHSIERAVLVPKMAIDSDFRLGNKELFDLIKSDDRLFGYLVVNPNYPDESIQLMRSAMSSRKFVAAAFFTGASRPYPNLDDCREILKAHLRFSKPAFVYTPDAEAVAAAEEIAREFPGMKFIFGSMGGPDWKRALTACNLLNIFLETSGSFDAEKIEEAVDQIGAHRVLFGSGMPFSEAASMLGLIQYSNLTKDGMAKILGQNATKLYNLDGPAQEPLEEE